MHTRMVKNAYRIKQLPFHVTAMYTSTLLHSNYRTWENFGGVKYWRIGYRIAQNFDGGKV